jgi:hypothetical protein
LNPLIARIVADPADYPWSNHRAYLATHPVSWVTTEFGLSLFCTDCAQGGSRFFDIPHAPPASIELTPPIGTVRLAGDEHFMIE